MITVILGAGEGKRLGNIEKPLIKIGNKYLIEYSLKYARILKLPIYVVIKKDSKIPEVIGKHVNYIIQPKPLGTMDAIKRVLQKTGELSIFLMLGDEILIDTNVRRMRACYLEHFMLDGIIGCLEETDPKSIQKTYEVRTYGNYVERLREKPVKVLGRLKGTGYCILGNRLLKEMINSKEKNFVEAIDYAIRKGCLVGYYKICSKYFNINTLEDLREAEEYFKH